jgi:regulator of protease activity HflC (stomatin/prohibitin superfamily)
MDGGSIAGIVIGAVAALIIVILFLRNSIKVVQEKEVMIIERFGQFSRQLTAGINFLVPFVDRPRV